MPEQTPVLDAAGGAFFAQELTRVQAKIYRRKFPQYLALSLLPPLVEDAGWAEYVEYECHTDVGRSGFIADASIGGPRVDVEAERRKSPTFRHGNHYGWTIWEIQAAQANGKPLADSKAMSSRRAHDELTDQLAWLGDSTRGVVGLLNHPDVPRTPSAGTFASLVATPTAVLAELNDFVNGIVDRTNGTATRFTVLLPQAQYDLCASTLLASGVNETILSFFQRTNPHVESVRAVPRLNGAGAGGADVAVAYPNTIDTLALHLVAPYTPMPPETETFEMRVNTFGVFGAVEIYYPYEVGVLEGI